MPAGKAWPWLGHSATMDLLDGARSCHLSDVISLCLTSFLTFVAFVLSLALYRRYFHPLARLPGPPLAAITSIWYAYHVRNGHMYQLGTELHRKYGPVVRVRPNEVWLNSKDAFKAIYSSTSGYDKSDFYLATALLKPKVRKWFRLESPDTLDLLAERNMKRYRLQRRLIGPVYHMNNIKQYESIIDGVLSRVITQLRSINGQEVDLKEWMHIIAVECLSAISLSWSPGYLNEKSDGASGGHAYMGWRRRSVFGLFPFIVILETFSSTLGRIFATLWGVTYHTPKQGFKPFFPAVQKKITQRIKAGLNPGNKNVASEDIVSDLIQLHLSRPEFNVQYLRRMAITNFGAGHETLTSTLVSAMAMIGSHSMVQEHLADMLGQHSGPSAYEDAACLEYTRASIKEAQRLYPVIGMSLPRVVPKQGLALPGLYLPPETIVGCNPVSLHRNSDIFGPEAEAYHPERWLNKSKLREFDQYNLIYGGGPRICPGKHLAEMLVLKIVQALVKHFIVHVKIPPEGEICYYFMAMLTGVKVSFTQRAVSTPQRGTSSSKDLGIIDKYQV